jgi:hypothetical protein
MDKKQKEKLQEIRSWGVLTLMSFMREVVEENFEKDRRTIGTWSSGPYGGSTLEICDKTREAVMEAFHRNFKKLYDEAEKKYEASKKS